MAKNFMKDGKWVEKTTLPDVHKCQCGGRYIKTRLRQNMCLRCMVGVR